jgi:serine O-acetyltransferase
MIAPTSTPAPKLLAPMPRGDRNENPPDLGIFALLREDLRTHDGNLFEQGFWAVAVHRLGNWRMGIRFKPLRFPFTVLYRFLFKLTECLCGISIPYATKLGRRVRIWHFGGMVLHARSIGNDVHLRQNTSIGNVRKDLLGLPIIEDGVDIGCGACILGNITIGHDSIIGANAVVLQDIPPHSVAVGLPAKVVKTLKPVNEEATTGDG